MSDEAPKGWSRWHYDPDGEIVEEYWEPGMKRTRIVKGGHISYGVYVDWEAKHFLGEPGGQEGE
ncbi:MAG: hypothetical protein M3P49_09980 [Actinomycetota bacterium]|nr:hypothetical protein [Actinomycetota bacterium]